MSSESNVVTHEPIQLQGDLSYLEIPVRVLDMVDRVLRNKLMLMVKVLWIHHSIEDATWELYFEMEKSHPHLF